MINKMTITDRPKMRFNSDWATGIFLKKYPATNAVSIEKSCNIFFAFSVHAMLKGNTLEEIRLKTKNVFSLKFASNFKYAQN